jgi:ABC-type nitrate/sulfonate/bicarbonate transport system substrate-binding protein
MAPFDRSQIRGQTMAGASTADAQAGRTDVWYTVCPVPAASSVAFARGEYQATFADTDVILNPIRTHPDRKVREAHYDQTQPNAFREGGNIPPLWARSDGRDLKVIGLSWIDHHSAVIALPGSGIETPADLAGRRLALVARPNDPVDYPRATQLHGYLAALSQAGLGLADVELVDIELSRPLVGRPPEAQALSQSQFSARVMRRWQGPELRALLAGEVDALHVSAQGLELAELAGAITVCDIGSLPERADRINNLAPVVFTVRGELLASAPDVVDRYLAQALRTATWAEAHPEEAKRIIARDSGVAEELVDAIYSAAVHEALRPSMDSDLIELLARQKEFLLGHGFLERDFDGRAWIEPEPLRRAAEIVAADPADAVAQAGISIRSAA